MYPWRRLYFKMRRKISSVAGRFRNIADVKEKVEEVVYGVRDTESLRKGKV